MAGTGVLQELSAFLQVQIEEALLATWNPPPVHRASSLEEAVEIAVQVTRAGDRVLFSPMCPSYDQFLNFAERGSCFKKLVREKVVSEKYSTVHS